MSRRSYQIAEPREERNINFKVWAGYIILHLHYTILWNTKRKNESIILIFLYHKIILKTEPTALCCNSFFIVQEN